MLAIDISIGRTYSINGVKSTVKEVGLKGSDVIVNKRYNILDVKPIPLTEDIFSQYDFKFYNGWYYGDEHGYNVITFVEQDKGYICYIGSHEETGIKIMYLHELQNIVYLFGGELI